jgi:hypothetical protein
MYKSILVDDIIFFILFRVYLPIVEPPRLFDYTKQSTLSHSVSSSSSSARFGLVTCSDLGVR